MTTTETERSDASVDETTARRGDRLRSMAMTAAGLQLTAVVGLLALHLGDGMLGEVSCAPDKGREVFCGYRLADHQDRLRSVSQIAMAMALPAGVQALGAAARRKGVIIITSLALLCINAVIMLEAIGSPWVDGWVLHNVGIPLPLGIALIAVFALCQSAVLLVAARPR